jgi:hypothetical protein
MEDVTILLRIIQIDTISDEALEETVELLEAISSVRKATIKNQFEQSSVDFLIEMLGMKASYVSWALLNVVNYAEYVHSKSQNALWLSVCVCC